jgi:hypothetical protein
MVRCFGAIQAQEYPEAKWAIALRTRNVTSASLDRALAEGTLIRTHVLRPTWHLVLPEDLRWMLDLTAPRIRAGSASRWRQLELDEATFERCNDLFIEALGGGHQLTRLELAEILEAKGISTAGQRMPHILLRSELDQVVCSGGLKGKQGTWALFDERIPKAPSVEREDALADLTRRYFTSHGPATAQDFAWWSGLTLKDVKAGLAANRSELVQETLDGQTYWSAEPAKRNGAVSAHLLPNYDELLVAYKDHRPSFDPGMYATLGPKQDLLRNQFAVNGLVVGEWRRTATNQALMVELRPGTPLREAERQAVQAAAERYGKFVRQAVAVKWA